MLFRIRHVTRYRYDSPVRESVMQVLKQPRSEGLQRLENFQLATRPRATLFSYADHFGNAVHHFDVPGAHSALEIEATAQIEVAPPQHLPERMPASVWDTLRSDAIQAAHFDMLAQRGIAAATPLLERFLAEKGLAPAADPLSSLRRLRETIAGSFAYAPQTTQVDSPIDDALAKGKGVCQDFSHIMIAICRLWGIPTRYVSGYLHTRRDEGDRSEPDATHAWVEAFLPPLGWIGIDPTNNSMAGERHIRVAVGRDYDDVPPTRGVFKGPARSELALAVEVASSARGGADQQTLKVVAPMPKQPEGATTARLFHEQQHQQQQ